MLNANAISKFNAAAAIKFSSLSILFQRRATFARAVRTLRHKIQPHNVPPRVKFRRRVAVNLRRNIAPRQWRHSTRSIGAVWRRSAAGLTLNLRANFKSTLHSATKSKSGDTLPLRQKLYKILPRGNFYAEVKFSPRRKPLNA